jgi:UDP-glucuronate 4-epimerase
VSLVKVLITGGAGFIGSHLTDRLLAENYQIVSIDNFDAYYEKHAKLKNIEKASRFSTYRFVEGDIRDFSALEKCFSQEPIDVVVHLAARGGVRPSIQTPGEYYDVNVNGTLRLLEVMDKWKVRKLVFASSSSVYGNSSKIPFSESDNVDRPISPYAATKISGELLCHAFHHLHGFDVFCLRLFTVYGPRQRPDMAIHKFIRSILSGSLITLYGDGTSRRDYTFVSDIVEGILRSIERVAGYEIINLGESRTVSLLELMQCIERAVGRNAVFDWKPMQPGDVNVTYADISKARLILGYAPEISIEDGIKKMVNWFLTCES